MVEVGVGAVQEPAVPFVDRDPGLAGGVARQRDEEDLGIEVGEDPDALEPLPLVAVDRVLDPVRPVAPVRGQVAGALAKARVHRRPQLRLEDVDLGVGEVG